MVLLRPIRWLSGAASTASGWLMALVVALSATVKVISPGCGLAPASGHSA